MQRINATLEAVLSQHRLLAGIAAYGIVAQWEQLVGRPLARWTTPLRVVGGTLWIKVESSTVQHHLAYLAPRLVHRINLVAPAAKIQRVRFTLRDVDA